jgi:branched-subunit amino acid aminotransferase/4-amino-4-deoxychorismate lyase
MNKIIFQNHDVSSLKLIETWAFYPEKRAISRLALSVIERDQRFESHYQRYLQSAHALGFRPATKEDWCLEIIPLLENAQSIPLILRVECDSNAHCSWTARPLEWPERVDAEVPVGRIEFSQIQIDSHNQLFKFKTNHPEIRMKYDRALAEARRRRSDLFDILIYNENDEITEGTRTNIFIREGQYWITPPVSCGLLPGIERQNWIEEARVTDLRIREEILTRERVSAADEIVLTNSVRGRVKVEW